MSHFLTLIILLLFSGDKGDNDYYYYYYGDNDDGNMTNRFCTSKLQKVVSSTTEDEEPHLANYLSKKNYHLHKRMIVVVTIIVNPSLYDRRIPTHYNIMIILAHSLPWYIYA